MTLSPLTQPTRRKAVWGPKRILTIVAFLMAVVFPLSVAAAPAGKQGKKAGQSNSNAQHDYRGLDRHLNERATNSRDPRETAELIVTLDPGEQLPTQFRKFACGPSLDIIKGQTLCNVPVNRLAVLSKTNGIHRVHSNRGTKDTDTLSSVAVQADLLTKQYGYNGAGITVAFLDSGLTEYHPDLNHKNVLKFVDFVGTSRGRIDEHGHGTHVTGVVNGNGSVDPRFAGIAPGTKIVSLRVLDAKGKGSIGQIIAALDWVWKNAAAYNIRIVNLSVGAGVYESYWTDPLTLATKALVDQGITVVAAAGNLGKNAKGELLYGGITSPGVAPWVLTACAFSTMGTPETGDDAMASFSSVGPTAIDFTAKPDVCAPGVGIVSLTSPGSTLYQKGLLATPSWLTGSSPIFAAQPYISLSGTSQATPFVTGTVAMMLQANPNLTPNLIKAILQYTATFQSGVSPLRQGAGFMNSLGAVTLASFYAHATPESQLTADPSWSQHIIWGNHMLSGGVIDPKANAWAPGVEWGWAYTNGDDDGDNIVWGTGDDDDNIVWGTSDDDDNIVWGTGDDDDNIVWGTDCGGDDCDNIVWGTADDEDNIVWGTADDDDNIVWGTSDDDDNIVWGTGDDDDNIVWGTGDDDDNIVWGTAAGENIVWPVNQSSAKKGGK